MKKIKYLSLILFIVAIFFLMPNVSNAAVEVTKSEYDDVGSLRFTFTGLTLDKEHEYEYGFTKMASSEVTTWHLIHEYTETTAIVDIGGDSKELASIITVTETGYITIKDKTDDSIVLEPYAVDLAIPYLNISNYKVINNGKAISGNDDTDVKIRYWNGWNSTAYYQYEKITDDNVISKFKEIKSQNEDYSQIAPLLKTEAPTVNWKKWESWSIANINTGLGAGCPQYKIEVPDNGLYYMWIYITGDDVRKLYGYILVDNLDQEIELDKISLPETSNVKLGETITLNPTFNPTNTTQKIVTWTSSNEDVATVDNTGKVTPKKIGSTIITVTSQDGSKKASCTVTVVQSSNNSQGTENENSNGSSTTNGESTSKAQEVTTKEDQTVVTTTKILPKTGVGLEIISAIVVLLAIVVIAYYKYFRLKGIK